MVKHDLSASEACGAEGSTTRLNFKPEGRQKGLEQLTAVPILVQRVGTFFMIVLEIINQFLR